MPEPGARATTAELESATTTPVELLRALALFAEPPAPEHAHVAEAVGLGPPPDSATYSDVFVFQLYPYASVHVGDEGMMGGEARDRVAGFWSAVGRDPPPEPDHLSALLGLYGALAEEEARASEAARTLVQQSRRALMEEHLAPWAFAFLDRVRELAGGFYAAWAELLAGVLEVEASRLGPPDDLPVHLEESNGLPDPRAEGTLPFLAGLLAPARAGMILTRADLADVARTLVLGLRAGERRYALEHLLAQEPAGVLGRLAEEAVRQAAGHARRRPYLGPTAEFLRARALATATLLDTLAREAAASEQGACTEP